MIQSVRGRLAAAVVLGAVAALGQAPFDQPVLMLAGMSGVVWLLRGAAAPARAMWLGWCFGAGYFALTLHWIVSPFLVDAARHGWMAPFALVLLAGGLALFWGAAFWGARRLGRGLWPLILCWPLAEFLRAYVFTGFPWAMPAQALVDVVAGQALAWVGPHGASLMLVAAAVALAEAFFLNRLVASALAAGLAVVLVLPPSVGPAPLTGQVLRLVQPNAAQHEKWDPEKVMSFFNLQLSYTAAPPTPGLAAPTAVIWSESAIPWSLENAGPVLPEISAAANGVPVILGVQRHSESRVFNALVMLGPAGEVAQSYDKHHLVPFGEYIPLGDLVGRFGLRGLAAREGFGYSSGPGAQVIEVPGIGTALPLICYEAVFAQDVNAAPKRPAVMIQVTNDAWFGPAAGPLQHLAQARMRAIEQGVPLARSANTGVSAMIDPKGRVIAMLPLHRAGFVDGPLPRATAPTLYARTGDAPLAMLLVLGLLARLWTQRFRITD